jgi:MYXO-CTERM domain-containing protein
MAVTALLTGWPEYQRLWPYVGAPGISVLAILSVFDPPRLVAVLLGLAAAGLWRHRRRRGLPGR